MVARPCARVPRLVASVLGVVARAVVGNPGWLLRCCYAVAKYLVWLLGCCYVVARVLVVVAMVSGGGC